MTQKSFNTIRESLKMLNKEKKELYNYYKKKDLKFLLQQKKEYSFMPNSRDLKIVKIINQVIEHRWEYFPELTKMEFKNVK